jgi:hypothetical protein
MTGAALWGRGLATDEKLKDGMTDFFLRSRWREVVARMFGAVGSWTFLWHIITGGLDGESGRIVMASNMLMLVVMLWASLNRGSKYAANHAASPLFVCNCPESLTPNPPHPRLENPRVGGSIPSRATFLKRRKALCL